METVHWFRKKSDRSAIADFNPTREHLPTQNPACSNQTDTSSFPDFFDIACYELVSVSFFAPPQIANSSSNRNLRVRAGNEFSSQPCYHREAAVPNTQLHTFKGYALRTRSRQHAIGRLVRTSIEIDSESMGPGDDIAHVMSQPSPQVGHFLFFQSQWMICVI